MGPKMDPGGLQKRVGETVGNLSGQKMSARGPRGVKKDPTTIFRRVWTEKGRLRECCESDARATPGPQGVLARVSSIEERKDPFPL